MFFNEDILFRNGPLALVWMAGNDEFKDKKGRRRRLYQSILTANLVVVCRDFRNLFPTMGTAHGLGLKKMGTLMKGIGVMFSIRIEAFARDVYEATIAMRRSVIVVDPRIDAPLASKSKAGAVSKKSVTLPEENDEFGALHMTLQPMQIDEENFGELPRGIQHGNVLESPRMAGRLEDFNIQSPIPFRIHESPVRPLEAIGEQDIRNREGPTRKRKRDEENAETMYVDVMERLQNIGPINQNAHCLREEVLIPRHDEVDPELDFGDENAFFDIMNFRTDEDAEVQQLPDLPGDDRAIMPPPASVTEEPTSNIGLEMQPRGMETPAGAGTRPENVKRRRNEGMEREADTTAIELGSLSSNEAVLTKRRGPRKKLIVDPQTTVSTKDWKEFFSANRRETNRAELEKRLIETRAPAKSLWTMLPRGLNCIMSAGRYCASNELQEMFQDTLKLQGRNRERSELGISREKQRQQDDTSRGEGGVSVDTFGGGRSGLTFPEIPEPEDPQDLMMSPRQTSHEDQDHDQPMGNFDVDVGPNENIVQITSVDVPPIQEDPIDPNRLESTTTFHELIPPSTNSRKRAAMAFFALLKAQAKKQVVLHQDEPYGPIVIERINADL